MYLPVCRKTRSLPAPTGRNAFSLVELLAVMFIIGVLIGLTSLAMGYGFEFATDLQQEAQAAKTRLEEKPRFNRFRPEIVHDQFVFIFNDSVTDPQAEAERIASIVPMEILSVFTNVTKGFSAKTKTYYAYQIRRQPTIAYAEREQKYFPTTTTVDIGRKRLNAEMLDFGSGSGTTMNPGIRNMLGGGAFGNGQGIGIAVLDTGADLDHPDLNIVNAFAAKGLGTPDDTDGHGTHVSGTIGAKDNGVGTTGIIPGASIWTVRVLGSSGGTGGQIIEGMDYVVANANDIQVANLSLGGGFSQVLNDGLNNMVAAGVVCCVAAGNSGVDASNTSPASAARSITVAALADSDGLPGGVGPKTTAGPDDTMATFSNFGPKVHVIAPGVGICSTYLNGTYKTLQGTSMASPHVAGMVGVIMSAPQQSAGSIRNVFTGQPVITAPGVRKTRDEVLMILLGSSIESFPGPDGLPIPLPNVQNF